MTEPTKLSDVKIDFGNMNDIISYKKTSVDLWTRTEPNGKSFEGRVLGNHSLSDRCSVGAEILACRFDVNFSSARLVSRKRHSRCFPLGIMPFRGIPINSHPGAFGCARKFNFHEGVDLYCEPGTHVFAVNDCSVVSIGKFTGSSIGMSWWLETMAVTVRFENDNGVSCYYVYGEIEPSPEIKVGDKLPYGHLIGKVIPVLPSSKKRSDIPFHEVSMLHFEKYNSEYDPSYGWASWPERDQRPVYLEDPTPDLLSCLSFYSGRHLIVK